MKSFICLLLIGLLFVPLLSAQQAFTTDFVSVGPIRTGFVVITPLTGIGEGLSVSETFTNQIGNSVFQGSVLASPLVTFTAVVVNSDTAAGLNTGIALINPNDVTAAVTLTVRSPQGIPIASRSIDIPPHQQISRFATEIFAGEPAFSTPLTGLVFINSSAPIGVLGLAFNGPAFSSLPVATQLSNSSVSTATSSVTTASVPINTTSTTIIGTTSTFTGLNSTAFVSGIPTVPSTILPLPSTFPPPLVGQPVTGVFTPLTNTTGTPTPLTITGGGQFQTVPTAQVTPPTIVESSTATPIVVTPTLFVFPQFAAGVGGSGAVLLPQFAIGGGWTSRVTVANTSVSQQAVRIDFFDSTGAALSLPSGNGLTAVIAAGGVVVF